MEIHDNVGQTLLLANVNLTILMSQIKENIEAIQLIQESKELLKKSMEDITAVSRSMNPDRIVEIGVFNAIAYELDVLKRKNILSVIIEIDEAMASDWQLKPEIQLVLFRIYQEGIKNILKYASASLVEFTLIRTQHGVDMLLKDNGVGFDLGLSEKRDGIGLRNIQKRVAIFNGSFDIESAPGKGTTLRIFIPSIEFTIKPIP
jgi:signal transduction histidine kinase